MCMNQILRVFVLEISLNSLSFVSIVSSIQERDDAVRLGQITPFANTQHGKMAVKRLSQAENEELEWHEPVYCSISRKLIVSFS